MQVQHWQFGKSNPKRMHIPAEKLSAFCQWEDDSPHPEL
jgi:hypothetical protein